MRKRNYTVTIRMSKAEYDLLQSKVKESGRTQQEVVIKAIADLKIASTEEVEELKRLNQMFADILSQLRGATTNINQIARKLYRWRSSKKWYAVFSIKIFGTGRRVKRYDAIKTINVDNTHGVNEKLYRMFLTGQDK